MHCSCRFRAPAAATGQVHRQCDFSVLVRSTPLRHACPQAYRRITPTPDNSCKPSVRGLVAHATSAYDLDDLELDTPEIDNDLESYQAQMGASFNGDSVPVTFGNDQEALDALQQSCALTDLSHWDRLHISGKDRLTFLHGQSTYDCAKLQPGTVFDTVFVTAQGRCLELAKCLVQQQGVLVLVSPGSGSALATRLNKYILYGDEVSIADVTAQTKMFSLAGPESSSVLEGLGATAPGPNQVALMGFQNGPVVVAGSSGLSVPGYTLMVEEMAAGELWRSLAVKGAVSMGHAAWQIARIQDGRPEAGQELTEQHLPLEAGLYHAVSLNKGCYMGQETLAKVHKLNAVKQQLHGLLLDAEIAPGTPLLSGKEKAGAVTSVTQLPDGNYIGLGYVRCRANGVQIAVDGLQLTAGGVRAQVVSRPFASWHFPEGQGVQEPPPQSAGDLKDRALAAKANKEADREAEAAAKEERVRVMQERLAAWQASQAK